MPKPSKSSRLIASPPAEEAGESGINPAAESAKVAEYYRSLGIPNPMVQFLTDGNIVGANVALPKKFKTGSRGFSLNAKIEIKGRRFQANLNLVEVGTKDGSH